jgi:type IV pilus assembly protein PilW
MLSPIKFRTRNAGFSLIEIIVGMVMGLISMVVVMQVFASFEGQKRTTTSGSDAQTNGGVGLYTIERDIRMAGYGFADALGCPVRTAQVTPFNLAGAIPSFILAPVTIIRDSSKPYLPYTIRIMGSNKQNWSQPVRNVSSHSSHNYFDVSSALGIKQNDLLIAYETDTAGTLNCSLIQISNGNPVTSPINYANTGTGWNGNASIFPIPDFTTNALLLNTGSLMVNEYSLDANGNLVSTDYNSANNTYNPAQTLSSDVVNLQAQYGFDTRTAAALAAACPASTISTQCSIVDTWSSDMVNADGIGSTGDAGDIARIYAVRFAVVARSGSKEKPDLTTGVCNATTTNPTWAGGTIPVDKNPDGTTKADWMCYRYKTFETVVPLRNTIWKLR